MNQTWEPAFRNTVLIVLIAAAALTLWYIRAVFEPLIVAALTAYFLSPAVNFITTRLKLPRKISANLVYFAVLALLIAIPFTVLPGLLDEIQDITTDLTRALDNLQALLNDPIRVGSLNVYLGNLIPALRDSFNGGFVPGPQDALRLIEMVSRNFLWTLVILVTVYYLMTDWSRLRLWLIELAPEPEQSDLHRLYDEIRKVWMGYLGGQFRLIVILAVLYSIVWFAIGLPGAVIIGPLAGLLNLLPEIGPAAVAVLAVIVALIEGSTYLPISHVWFAALALGVYLLINNIKTIWIQPRVLGHSVLLHEGLVFIGIVTAIMLQGVLGVLIVVPLLATILVVGRYLRRRMLGLSSFDDDLPTPLADPGPVAPALTESRPKRRSARRTLKS